MVELMTRWQNTTSDLLRELGREPTPVEVAQRMELKEEAIASVRGALRTASRYTQSLMSDDDDSNLADIIVDPNSSSPSDQLVHGLELTRMLKTLSNLDKRQQSILRMRFGLGYDAPMTLKEIGLKLGLTRERVRQIQNEALARLFEILEGEDDARSS
jgi:RNA polymerase primary sigma factor